MKKRTIKEMLVASELYSDKIDMAMMNDKWFMKIINYALQEMRNMDDENGWGGFTSSDTGLLIYADIDDYLADEDLGAKEFICKDMRDVLSDGEIGDRISDEDIKSFYLSKNEYLGFFKEFVIRCYKSYARRTERTTVTLTQFCYLLANDYITIESIDYDRDWQDWYSTIARVIVLWGKK